MKRVKRSWPNDPPVPKTDYDEVLDVVVNFARGYLSKPDATYFAGMLLGTQGSNQDWCGFITYLNILAERLLQNSHFSDEIKRNCRRLAKLDDTNCLPLDLTHWLPLANSIVKGGFAELSAIWRKPTDEKIFLKQKKLLVEIADCKRSWFGIVGRQKHFDNFKVGPIAYGLLLCLFIKFCVLSSEPDVRVLRRRYLNYFYRLITKRPFTKT